MNAVGDVDGVAFLLLPLVNGFNKTDAAISQ